MTAEMSAFSSARFENLMGPMRAFWPAVASRLRLRRRTVLDLMSVPVSPANVTAIDPNPTPKMSPLGNVSESNRDRRC